MGQILATIGSLAFLLGAFAFFKPIPGLRLYGRKEALILIGAGVILAGVFGSGSPQSTGPTSSATPGTQVRASTENATPTNTPNPTATPIPPTATPKPEPITLSGRGQTATEPVRLAAGIFVASFTHTGSRNFIIYAHKGESRDLLINRIGQYEGSRPLNGPGEIVFDVQADGAWTVSIKPIASSEDIDFEGQGDAVSTLFQPPGTGPLEFNHGGQRNFIVYQHCAGGSNLIQNQIGHVSGSRVVSFSRGPCFWEVQADGSWSIRRR